MCFFLASALNNIHYLAYGVDALFTSWHLVYIIFTTWHLMCMYIIFTTWDLMYIYNISYQVSGTRMSGDPFSV